jgi:monovalent cation/hydrogen antiporter
MRAARASGAAAASRRPMTMPTVGGGLAIAWCGMRGIVTLAAAMALPDGSDGAAFPYRDLILFCAFAVVLVTLIVQGMTLRPLIAWVGLQDDGSVDREVRLARVETARAALKALDGPHPSPSLETLRREYEVRIRLGDDEAQASPAVPAAQSGAATLAEALRRAVAAQRLALLDLRARSTIGDDAFHVAEEELDLLELSADERIRPET